MSFDINVKVSSKPDRDFHDQDGVPHESFFNHNTSVTLTGYDSQSVWEQPYLLMRSSSVR